MTDQPLNDHTKASLAALDDLMAGEGSTETCRATAAITHALHAVADAIRATAPIRKGPVLPMPPRKTPHAPHTAPQAEDGHTDGGNATEAGEPRFKAGGFVSSPWVIPDLRDRAEKAERERDAILKYTQSLRRSFATGSIRWELLTDIINRHTPEG